MSYHPAVDNPVIADGYVLASPGPGTRATFYPPGDNPFLPIVAADGRGAVSGLDFGSERLYLVEVIHSEPGAVRGNHVHRRCTEIFTVLSGDLSVYVPGDGGLLCEHRLLPGTTVVIPPHLPHAMYTRTGNESIAVFRDGDPRDDRDRVMLLEFPAAGS